MKILDRYVLFSFLRNYLISFMVLIGMYIVLDMVFNFDELVEVQRGMRMSTLDVLFTIGDYYFYQSFLIFVHLSGVIPVVAAGFTFIRLSRFNELSAILAAGVQLHRVAMPVIIAAVILQVLLVVDQEMLIPNMIPKLTRSHSELYKQTGGKSYEIQAMQDDRNGLLFAGKFTPGVGDTPATMHAIDIIEGDQQLQAVAHITADDATWDAENHQWNLSKGRRISGLRPQEHRSSERPISVYKSNITPDEIALYHSGEFINLLSRERINQLLERPQIYGAIDLLRVKHFRLSQFVTNIVMLLVAIPCVLTREPGRLKRSIFRCLVLVGLCMASFFIAYQIAGLPPAGPQWADKWPAMLAAAPVIVFGPIAVFLLDTLPT
jgi:lipopolysaccharide export LptBFGC system permease protein LptF